MLHEAGGHAVQKKFGLLGGSNPDQFGATVHKNKAAEYKDQLVGVLKSWVKDPEELSAMRKSLAVASNGPAGAKGAEHLLPPNISREDRKFAIKNLEDWNREVDGYFSAKKKYRDTAGEAMARLTEARRQLTPGERLEDYPFEPRSFERLTKSRIEDLWDPGSGGGVQ